MTVYYNENDPQAAEWLRQLVLVGAIPPGDVDERSIEDVRPADIAGYTQCHFFAGIGGWPEALRIAGWPDDRPVWTGSCPCQPFSQAGTRLGFDDPRHVWPIWRWLLDNKRPPVVLGEQVAGETGIGWYAGVRADMEAMGYAVGTADLCAPGVYAPHIRQRLFWVANANHQGPQRRIVLPERSDQQSPWAASLDNWITCTDGRRRRVEPLIQPLADGIPERVGLLRGYGNAIVPQLAATFIKTAIDSLPHRY